MLEINKWAPDYCVTQITNTGPGDKQNFAWDSIYGTAHFIITSYDHLRNLPNILKDQKVDLIIADEAHKLRKQNSKINKSINLMEFNYFWGLSGTPIERDTNDLINLLTLMDKKLNIFSLKSYSNNHLSAIADTYILRRMKNDVLKDMKSFFEKNHYVELNKDQRNAYEELKLEFISGTKNILKKFGELREICDLFNESSSKLDYVEDMLEKIMMQEESV